VVAVGCSEWAQLTIDGVSLPEALQCWEDGGRNEKNHYERNRRPNHHHQHQHQQHAARQRLHDSLPRLLTG